MQAYHQELATAAIVLAGTVGGVLVLRFILVPLLAQAARRATVPWDEAILVVVVTPLMALGLLLGVRMALLQFSSVEPYVGDVIHWSRILTTLIAIWALLRLSNFIARQRIGHLIARDVQSRVQYVNALRKILAIVIVVVGGVTLVGQMGYKITPLLTGLGIGGLAIALALQDTLSNIFAGFYMMFDQPIRVGDYIQLKSGEEGFVQEIGWRNTRIRPWSNSEIVVPNGMLAQTIFTNHYLPVQELSVVIECGVSYYSHLEEVERVTKDVAQEVMGRVAGSAPQWEPLVHYHTFGDSNVEFRVILRVLQFEAQYALRSEFIKALHRRFAADGIEISFPMRKLEISQPPADFIGPGDS